MKTTNLKKIENELAKGFGKKSNRFGIEYAWYNAHALDAGIQTRANNAKKWRNAVLELAEQGVVTEQKVTFAYDGMKRWKKNGTAYYVDGELRLLVSRGKMYKDLETWQIIS